MKCELIDYSRDGHGMISITFMPEDDDDQKKFLKMRDMGFVTSEDYKDGRVVKFCVPLHQKGFRLFP